MTLSTALVWFIVAAGPHTGQYLLGSLGPFPTREHCEASRKYASSRLDRGAIGSPFLDRTECLQLEVVIGKEQSNANPR